MPHSAQVLTIEAGNTERNYWRDIWRCHELLYSLALRDISVRYKQTVLGIGWVILRPLLTMLVFTLVFGRLADLPSGGAPYSVMVFSALIPWLFFSNTLVDAGNSIVSNSGMISKVYFPRLLVPLSTVVVGLLDFCLAFILLLGLMLFYGLVPDWRILTLPLFLGMALVASIGIGIWVAALNVKYRDFRFIVAFAVQLGFYISPVGYSSNIIPEKWRLLYSLNPVVGVIDGFHWALLPGARALYWPGIFLSMIVGCVLLVSSVLYFRKAEKSFADEI